MGFERTMNDGEIMRRLMAYAKPYRKQFVVVLFLMLFSIAYDIISPLIVGNIEELVATDFAPARAVRPGGGLRRGTAFFDGQHLPASRDSAARRSAHRV